MGTHRERVAMGTGPAPAPHEPGPNISVAGQLSVCVSAISGCIGQQRDNAYC